MKWTIGIVNYYSSCYLKWQIKMLNDFNDKNDFQLVIVDNSNNHREYKKLSNLVTKYDNIILVKNVVHKDDGSSMQHGRGLDIALNFAKYNNSKYFLTIDPDCFFLEKGYLSFFEKHMSKENVFVGTQYSNEKQKKIGDHADFPCAFFCSYNLQKIGYDISFLPCSRKTVDIDKTGKDVGYKIRDQYHYMQYMSFKQDTLKTSPFAKGKLFRKNFEYYFLGDQLIAVHFNKTSRNFGSSFAKNFYWDLLRSKNAKICYKYISNNL